MRPSNGHDGARAALDDASPAHLALDVLVVDDDKDSRELISIAVHSQGHRCRVAADGAIALQLLGEAHSDLVISDWDMPEMTGEELCRRVRSGGDDVPYTYFIIMTAFDDRAHLVAGMAAGADDFQRKPVSPDALQARLLTAGRVVEQHRRLAACKAKLTAESAAAFASARTDALTGVTNRLGLDEEIGRVLLRAARYGHSCSLALCDVDLFESYDERHGHAAGDDALRSVAEAMRGNLRAVDTVFRYGLEAFAVLLLEQTPADAGCAMDRLRACVEDLAVTARRGPLTLSIGVAALDASIDRAGDTWLARAGAALHEAKVGGRNRVVTSKAATA